MTPTKFETATPHTLPSPHEPRGTSNIEHPTPNIEWQRESSLTSAFGVRCWMFDVFPRFRVSTREFSFHGNLSPSDGERGRVRWSSEILQTGLDGVVVQVAPLFFPVRVCGG